MCFFQESPFLRVAYALLESHTEVAGVYDGGIASVAYVFKHINAHGVAVVGVQRVVGGALYAYRRIGERQSEPSHERVYLVNLLYGLLGVGHVGIHSILDNESFGQVSLLEVAVAHKFCIQTSVAYHAYLLIVPAVFHALHFLGFLRVYSYNVCG